MPTSQITHGEPPLRIADAARELGLHPETLRRRVHDGSIAFVRIGPSIRIPAAEVRRLQGR